MVLREEVSALAWAWLRVMAFWRRVTEAWAVLTKRKVAC